MMLKLKVYLKQILIASVWLFATEDVAGQMHLLNDEFNSPCSIDNWKNITNVEGWDAEMFELIDIGIENTGQLTIMPHSTTWYRNKRGGFIFKDLTGNFIFTSRINVSNRLNNGNVPQSNFSLAGLMIRRYTGNTTGNIGWYNSQQDQEDYIFLSIGRANSNQWQFEVKSTTNSNSNLDISNIGSNEAYIRMIRKDNQFIVLYDIGNGWVVHERYDRENDFPIDDPVQVGFVVYTDWDNVNTFHDTIINKTVLNNVYPEVVWNPDIIGRFDFARYDSLIVPTHLAEVNYVTSVSDDTIAHYYGYPSIPHTPQGDINWLGTNSNQWEMISNWPSNSLPSLTQNVLISDCSCVQVNSPLIETSVAVGGLIMESGSELTINEGGSLLINLAVLESQLELNGIINNHGILHITNSSGLSIEIRNAINNGPTGQVIID